MNIAELIGETTEYDKKRMLEAKNPKAGVKVLAHLQIPPAEL